MMCVNVALILSDGVCTCFIFKVSVQCNQFYWKGQGQGMISKQSLPLLLLVFNHHWVVVSSHLHYNDDKATSSALYNLVETLSVWWCEAPSNDMLMRCVCVYDHVTPREHAHTHTHTDPWWAARAGSRAASTWRGPGGWRPPRPPWRDGGPSGTSCLLRGGSEGGEGWEHKKRFFSIYTSTWSVFSHMS